MKKVLTGVLAAAGAVIFGVGVTSMQRTGRLRYFLRERLAAAFGGR